MATILKLERREHFVTIDRTLARDERISLRARGLLLYLLSLPEDWNVATDRICHEVKEGRDAVRAAMRELESVGYVSRINERGDRGRIRTVVVVREAPATDFQASVDQASVDRAPADQASKEREIRKRDTKEPNQPYGLDAKKRHTLDQIPQPNGKPLSKVDAIVASHLTTLKPLLDEGAAFNLPREIKGIYRDAWQQALDEDVRPQAVARNIVARYYATVVDEDPDWGLIGKLVNEFGILAIDGVAEALGADAENGEDMRAGWYRYARRVCQRLYKEALVNQRAEGAEE